MRVLCFIFILLVVNTTADKFDEWKSKFHKKYKSPERENKRRDIFSKNLEKVKKHNSNGNQTYTLGMNRFADLSEEEFSSLFKGYKKPANKTRNEIYEDRIENRAPYSFDWRNYNGYNWVSPVKHQGECGSCWAFSAVGALESRMAIKYWYYYTLSEQNLVDCVRYGCDGGWPSEAFDFAMNNGVEWTGYYPYTGQTGSCQFDPDNSVIQVSNRYNVPVNEATLASIVASSGPVSVAIDARGDFQLYKSGVYNPSWCSSTRLDHAVLVVGYGTDRYGGDYWIVKNSWGTDWGDQGYIKMARNRNNKCGIVTAAVYPVVK